MATDSRRDSRILSAFEGGDGPEPLTAAAVADTLGIPEDSATAHLTALADRGAVHTKEVGEARVWWPSQEADETARRRLDLFENIQDLANVGAWEYDIRSEDGWASDEVLHIHGLAPGTELSPEQSLEFYHPADRQTVEAAFERAVDEGEPYDVEARLVDADGETRWVRSRGQAQYEDGAVVRVRGTTQDITERKRQERELERKSRALDEAPVGVTITDPGQADNPMIYVNQQFVETTGYDEAESLGRNCRFLQGEQTDPATVAAMRESIDADEPISVELRNEREDGTTFWNQVTIAPVSDESGAVTNYVGFQQDVTARKERERALTESRNRYRTLAENFPNGAVALVDEDLRYTTVGGTPIEDADTTPSELTGQRVEEALPTELAELVVPHYSAALEGETREFEATVRDREYQFRVVPVGTDDGEVFAAMGVSQDITDRKRQLQALEKRERILRELHAATREFYPPESERETAEFLVEFVENAFGFEYVSVKQFDEETGALEPAARSTAVGEAGVVGPVEPGPNPIWEVYRQGESRVVDGEPRLNGEALDVSVTQTLVVPVGEFGVTLAYTTGDHEFDDVDTDLIEVVTANADATLQRLRSDRVRGELVDQLSAQQAKVDDLRGIIDAIQAIQQRLAASDSQDALETGICEELVDTGQVDFVWVGRPQGTDTELSPTAWAGEGRGYLDSVSTNGDQALLPAQRAAAGREPYAESDVASLVVDQAWAKEALSMGLRSVASVPLVYDDVLYGVLTAYSRDEDAFGGMYEHLFTDVASLLVNYSRLLGHRYGDARGESTELEFELVDETYPLQRLAADTDSRLRFDTVAENGTDEIRALVTVLEGDAAQVLEAADSINSVVDAAWFGDREHDQLTLTVQKPFLASVVGKHGGTLVESVSEASGTRFRVELPRDTSRRPLLDSLSSRYREIEPVAQRQTGTSRLPGSEQVTDILTERQYEVLNAAYHGGYYETPRGVTGESLADSFDISSPAIYNHLQAAHRRILDTILQSGSDISDETGGLNS